MKIKKNSIDKLEVLIVSGNTIECPIIHRFTPGMYIREMFAPAGTLLTSKIHLTEHPFIVSKGKLSVWNDIGKEEKIEAPYCGITKKGTRRVMLIHEDTVWTTFHATDKLTPEEVEAEIIQPHINTITGTNINEDYKNNLITKKEEILCHLYQ